MNETILIKFKDGKGDGRMARFVNPDAVLHTDSHITLGGTTIYKSEVDWITYGDPVTGIAGRLDWRQAGGHGHQWQGWCHDGHQ